MSDFLDLRRAPQPRSLAGLSVAILAGGLGTRLRPVVSDKPKVMAEVGGRPFLAWWLDTLDQAGCSEVVLCTGHLAGQISDWFGSRHGNMTLHYSVEPVPLGTGGALRYALPHLHSEPVLALNGDSFCDVDLPLFYADQVRRRAPVMMALAQVDDIARYGHVNVQANGRIIEFREKDGRNYPGWINAGVYLISRQLLGSIPEEKNVSLERDLLPQWLSDGIFGFASGGRFIDIGTPQSLIKAESFFTTPSQVAAA